MKGEMIVVDDVPAAFATLVVEAFRTRTQGVFSLALSGGELARRCYERLAEAATGSIDWWTVDLYWAEELAVPLDDPASNYHLARTALLERVGAANLIHPMDCEHGPDPYQLRIGELGGLDLVHLGLASDGHVGSLFSGSAALSADPGRLVVMARDPSGRHPHERMTLTPSAIARAREVIVTGEGGELAPVLRQLLHDGDIPAARLDAANLRWVVDRAAARDLGTSV